MPECHLVFENGAVYSGQPFGAAADAVLVLVFNISMTGYHDAHGLFGEFLKLLCAQ